MNEKIVVQGRSIGIGGLLGVAFVVLKLCGVIDWSWWWVTCPFWAVPAIFLSIAIILVIVAGFCKAGLAILDAFERRK